MFRKLSYLINYLFQSVNEHGIHSPFVFDFTTKVLYNKTNFAEYSRVKKQKAKLLDDSTTIKIIDYGAGNNNGLFRVKNLVKKSSQPEKYGRLLFRISNYYKPKNILELGSNFGISTAYLALGNPNSNVISIEGCNDLAKYAEKNLHDLQCNNAEIICNTFQKSLPETINKLDTIDLVFFDGHHTYSDTINYFECCLTKINENSIFIFDDINWSEDMKKAWNFIVNDPKPIITIDLYKFGIVFFRKGQTKQNFVIRF